MFNFYILSAVSFIVLFHDVHSAGFAENKECVDKGLVIETRLKALLFVNDRFTKFNDKADVKPYCEEAKNLLADTKAYKKTQCLTRLARQVLSTIIPRFAQFVKKRCSEQGLEETLELAKCTSEDNRPQVNKCFMDYSSVIRYAANKVEDPTRVLNILCCNYHKVLSCLSSDNLKDCGKVRSSRYAHDVIEQFIGDIFNLMCARLTFERCQSEGLFDEIGKIKSKGKIDKEFLIIPALKAADKLTDF